MYDTILDAIAFLKSLENEIKNASKIELFSAFIKEDTLKKITKDISKSTDVKIVARWKYEDLVSKVSDLEVYNLCKSKNWAFGIDLNMHQKVYRFDESTVLLGSNNLTSSGLALHNNHNIEAGVKLEIKNQEIFLEYYKNVVWLDDILFEKLKKEISSFKPKKTNQDWSKEIKDLLIKPINFLYTYDFPHGPPEEKENIEFMQLINKDFKKSFLKSRIYMWVIESLRNSDKNEYTSFGWFSKKAHDSIINIPPPKRRDVKRLLENLFKWIVKYSDDIEIITHNKSEELKLK